MSLIEDSKDFIWRNSVRLSRPKRTLNEFVNEVVFDAVATDIYEENWDLLVVLDGCRPDVLRSVSDEYDFLTNIETAYSRGSSSQQWLSHNFASEYRDSMGRTAYVTGNPFSDELLSDDEFTVLDEVWRYQWDDERGTILPGALTDRAIHHGRETEADQMIVHYMQPHFPSIPNPELASKVDPETNVWINSVWERLEAGDLSRERVWQAYKENLRHVLDSVTTLLENVDAEDIVITADHGNGFGEAGIYGHPRLRTHRVLREVPWVTTTATDRGTREPTTKAMESDNDDVERRLTNLGYK